jgi:hypothetical protein
MGNCLKVSNEEFEGFAEYVHFSGGRIFKFNSRALALGYSKNRECYLQMLEKNGLISDWEPHVENKAGRQLVSIARKRGTVRDVIESEAELLMSMVDESGESLIEAVPVHAYHHFRFKDAAFATEIAEGMGRNPLEVLQHKLRIQQKAEKEAELQEREATIRGIKRILMGALRESIINFTDEGTIEEAQLEEFLTRKILPEVGNQFSYMELSKITDRCLREIFNTYDYTEQE